MRCVGAGVESRDSTLAKGRAALDEATRKTLPAAGDWNSRLPAFRRGKNTGVKKKLHNKLTLSSAVFHLTKEDLEYKIAT